MKRPIAAVRRFFCDGGSSSRRRGKLDSMGAYRDRSKPDLELPNDRISTAGAYRDPNSARVVSDFFGFFLPLKAATSRSG